MSDLEARVDALRRAGKHAEAAELCLAAGEIERASELFADVWQYDRAIEVAESAGLLALAYRHSLTAAARDATRRILEALADRPEQALEAAAHAEAKNRLADAARLFENAGDVARAASAYERAGELFEAARLREAQGQYREAGLLYERRVRESPDDGEAALRLGRVLAHFGRFEHAVRALQIAADDPDRRAAALRLMIACFAALGLMDAAASRLDELRLDDPSLPLTVPDFLEERFGDERGIAGLGPTEGAAEDRGRLLAGRYRILRPLGAGATGRVLLARDGFYERDVAVKVLTVGSGTAGRDAFVRFAREARVAAGLEHPNVVRVYDFNPDGPFLVMEYMPGGTLEDRIQGAPPVPLPVIRHVLMSVLAGLEAVHRRGVVHRDLKPANVFFGATGDVKIGDFGVAHLADLGATLTGAMLGTLAYMAPEQITGSGKPAASTDLYALGVILYRLLTGTLPFPGPDFVSQHLSDPPPTPSEHGAPSDAYDALVASLLAKDPAARPQIAADVRATIEALAWEDHASATIAAPREEPSSLRPSSVPPPPADRYVLLEPLADGAHLARDEDLGRTVRIEICSLERAEHLRALARADNPHLQAVYDIDPETGRAILEHPRGRLLTDLTPTPDQRAAIHADVARALATLHAASLAHGEVGPHKIRVADGRAVLLLPDIAHEPADRDRDLADLGRLG